MTDQDKRLRTARLILGYALADMRIELHEREIARRQAAIAEMKKAAG